MNKHTLRPSTPKGAHPSLFPLRMVLFTAELETPTQPPHTPRDPDELLAVKLIERIRHPQQVSLAGLEIEPPQPIRSEAVFEPVNVHV